LKDVNIFLVRLP